MLADALDRAKPDELIAVVSLADAATSRSSGRRRDRLTTAGAARSPPQLATRAAASRTRRF